MKHSFPRFFVLVWALALMASCAENTFDSTAKLPQVVRQDPAPKDHTRLAVAPQTFELDLPAVKKSSSNSKIGIWLWYLELHGYSTHSALAADLAAMGVGRIYVKVADGGYSPSTWPEVDNAAVPAAYHAYGIECWAWAYNYPGNEANQAKALYQSAKAGYDGFVTDIEIEFDGKSTELHSLLSAFTAQRTAARNAGYADSNFKFYATTWGNPADHQFRVDIVDQYVDAHMPQTYLEVWGASYMSNPTYWVNNGTQEYRDMGCVKPIHHIVSAEHNQITASQMNTFIAASGAETSVWRVPGGEAPLAIWDDLELVNWDAFATETGTITLSAADQILVNQPTPITGTVSSGITSVDLYLDQYKLATVAVSNGQYSYSATFNTAGNGRVLKAQGLKNGAVVATAQKSVNVVTAISTLSFVAPTQAYLGQAASFSGTVSSDVKRVVVKADAYQIADLVPANGAFAFQYTFNTLGNGRNITASAYNSSGALVAQTTKVLDVVNGGSTLTIAGPATATVGTAITFSGTAANAARVVVKVDGYQIADVAVANGSYSFAYTFTSAGTNRAVQAQSFSSSNALLATANTTITVTGGTTTPSVPYFYQYSNSINPGGSCQNTSMAMVLKHYGANTKPDDISAYWGTSKAQTPEGYQEMFNAEAAYLGVNVRSQANRYGTVTLLRQKLASGLPTVVHGYFTSYGHVVVVTGFDGTYYTVNDPAGKWCQVYGDGSCYGTSSTIGKGVKYHKDAFEDAIAPDGYVWMHELYFVNQ